MGSFAAAALAIAALGIYGVVAYSVTCRTEETGIRLALGAERKDVLRLVVAEGARLAISGAAVGIAASLAVTRLLSSLLIGVGATDPVTFAAVAVLLFLAALLIRISPRAARCVLIPVTPYATSKSNAFWSAHVYGCRIQICERPNKGKTMYPRTRRRLPSSVARSWK